MPAEERHGSRGRRRRRRGTTGIGGVEGWSGSGVGAEAARVLWALARGRGGVGARRAWVWAEVEAAEWGQRGGGGGAAERVLLTMSTLCRGPGLERNQPPEWCHSSGITLRW